MRMTHPGSPGMPLAAGRCLLPHAEPTWSGRLGQEAGPVVEVLSAAAVPILDDQVDGHLPLEAGDVAVTEVVAQVVGPEGHRGTGGTRGPGLWECEGVGGGRLLQLW